MTDDARPGDVDVLRDAAAHAGGLRRQLDLWLEQSRLLDGPYRNQGGEDEANYSLAWFPHYLVTGNPAILERFSCLLSDLAGWVRSDCVHGYEPEAEAHHGTEPFLLFLPRYLGLVPDDDTARGLLADAAHHIGNWESGPGSDVPEWYDWERDVFRGYNLGTRVVEDIERHRVELGEHLRFVHIALAAHRVLGEQRYLDWAVRYGRKRAERLVAASDPVPLAWDLDGGEIGWERARLDPKAHGMLALNHKVDGDPLGGIENHLASGAVVVYGDLFTATGEEVFRDAARRLVEPLIAELADPCSDPAAAAVSQYRVSFGDTSYDDAALRVIESAPAENDADWVLMEPERRGRRERGVGRRGDMLYWGEFHEDGSATPLREPSTAASALAWQIGGDARHARRALAGAHRKFGIARRILRGGREHADMGGAICSVAAGHGRNWGTGAVTGAYGTLLLGCHETRAEIVPAVRFFDAGGVARLPDDVLSLVRPAVGAVNGELLLCNAGEEGVTLTWTTADGGSGGADLAAGAIERHALES